MSVEPSVKSVAGHLIAVADLSRHAFEQAMLEKGLTGQQARAVLALERPMRMNELAEAMHCDASNITGLADRLESQRLVKRVPGEDRRVKLLTLTVTGNEKRRQLLEQIASTAFPVDVLSSGEKSALVRLLRKVLAG